MFLDMTGEYNVFELSARHTRR